MLCSGSFGAVIASSYYSRALVPEVLVDGGRFAVVRRRQTVEELIQAETIPSWIDEGATRAAQKPDRNAA